MDSLIPGIRRFHRNIFPARRTHFEELASGQKPSTLFITCSDSRVVPNLLTQSEPGELFELRNAGNLVPPFSDKDSGEAATIEYAVKALKVKQIVVCGHSHCGAITAVLRPELLRDMPAVEKWLMHAERVRQEIDDLHLSPDGNDDMLTTAVKANVLVQLAHLRTYEAVADAEAREELAVYGCFYRFETGEVNLYDPAANRFVSVHGLTNEPSFA